MIIVEAIVKRLPIVVRDGEAEGSREIENVSDNDMTRLSVFKCPHFGTFTLRRRRKDIKSRYESEAKKKYIFLKWNERETKQIGISFNFNVTLSLFAVNAI